ncbi:hypothetical protein [Mycobacterium sp. 1164985.4]|uniref:hypothetical protein n=1 Tax=Mycobacterium sp. 1164985.4 TaxID=1834069 RepID=UPI000A6EF69C|nr:hypothetical protein [Mycobacterium sp. 1164985.4]
MTASSPETAVFVQGTGTTATLVRERRGTTPLAHGPHGDVRRSVRALTGPPVRFY